MRVVLCRGEDGTLQQLAKRMQDVGSEDASEQQQ